jgi:hypothetical protein
MMETPDRETAMDVTTTPMYELRFHSLFDPGRAFSFPCDEKGRVEQQRLSERARQNLDRVLAAVGREFACPSVMRCS